VLVLEKFPEMKMLGDIISFESNAGPIFERWGLHERFYCLHQIIQQPSKLSMSVQSQCSTQHVRAALDLLTLQIGFALLRPQHILSRAR